MQRRDLDSLTYDTHILCITECNLVHVTLFVCVLAIVSKALKDVNFSFPGL